MLTMRREHLYRRHMHICLRCRHAFKTQKELDAHVVQAKACEPGNRLTEGITPEIEKKLKSRKKVSVDQSDKERWDDIYRLLFPGEDIPWPCKSFSHSIIRAKYQRIC